MKTIREKSPRKEVSVRLLGTTEKEHHPPPLANRRVSPTKMTPVCLCRRRALLCLLASTSIPSSNTGTPLTPYLDVERNVHSSKETLQQRTEDCSHAQIAALLPLTILRRSSHRLKNYLCVDIVMRLLLYGRVHILDRDCCPKVLFSPSSCSTSKTASETCTRTTSVCLDTQGQSRFFRHPCNLSTTAAGAPVEMGRFPSPSNRRPGLLVPFFSRMSVLDSFGRGIIIKHTFAQPSTHHRCKFCTKPSYSIRFGRHERRGMNDTENPLSSLVKSAYFASSSQLQRLGVSGRVEEKTIGMVHQKKLKPSLCVPLEHPRLWLYIPTNDVTHTRRNGAYHSNTAKTLTSPRSGFLRPVFFLSWLLPMPSFRRTENRPCRAHRQFRVCA